MFFLNLTLELIMSASIQEMNFKEILTMLEDLAQVNLVANQFFITIPNFRWIVLAGVPLPLWCERQPM